MKALMKKTFEWVDIDTTHIFNNQYNTVDGRRIFDSDIIRFFDDIRLQYPDMCKCGYCGKWYLTEEEYQKHLNDELAKARKNCKGCFWHSVGRETSVDSKLNNIIFRPDGSEIENKTVITTIRYTDKGCRHIPEYGNCHYEEHKKYDKQTFEKCYFALNPFGNLFDVFRIENNGSILYSSYSYSFNVITLEYSIYNMRRKYSGIAKLTDSHDVRLQYPLDCSSNSALTRAFTELRSMMDTKVCALLAYNERVIDDRYYTQPDGSILNEAVINGTLTKRPKPVLTHWQYIGEE